MIVEIRFNWSLLTKARDPAMARLLNGDVIRSGIASVTDLHPDNAVLIDPPEPLRVRDWLLDEDLKDAYHMTGRYDVSMGGVSIRRNFLGAVFRFPDYRDAMQFALRWSGRPPAVSP